MRIVIALCLVFGATSAHAGPLADALDRITPRSNPSLDLHDDALARDTARHRLETDGYAGVSTLLRGRDGQLQGKAEKDGRVYDIDIDRNGNVTAK
jgi:hypothetical protein